MNEIDIMICKYFLEKIVNKFKRILINKEKKQGATIKKTKMMMMMRGIIRLAWLTSIKQNSVRGMCGHMRK